MINMLGSLMEKADSMQEQMDKVSREMGILRKHEKKLVEIKTKKRNEAHLSTGHKVGKNL